MRAKYLAFALAFAICADTALAQDRLNPQELRFFETKIRPVLVEHCYECHSAESKELGGKLRLDTRGGLRAGGESGPALIPGRPDSSLLLLAMKHANAKLIMPPKDYGDKLPATVLKDFESWIRAGAPDPREQGNAPSQDSDEVQHWWAWQPLQASEVPDVVNPSWSKNNIDRFVLANLEKANLTPSPEADRITLVRRIAIDLTGLPPSQDDLQTYALNKDPRPLAELVDEYLASEQYGERFGRHWLDVARYAESTGKDVNVTFPHAWRYRDYVIDAFNSDMPFDQFVREQLAGDLLPPKDSAAKTRQLIATSFLAIGPKSMNEMNPKQFAVDLADEQIDAVSQAFLGVTIACARCHDHKFDPISQRDYTALSGIFLSTATHFGTTGGVGGRNRSTLVALPDGPAEQAQNSLSPRELQSLRDRVAELQAEQRELITQRQSGKPDPSQQIVQLRIATQLVQLNLKLDSVDAQGRTIAQVMATGDKPLPAPNNSMRQRLTARFQPGVGRAAPELQSIFDSPQLIRGEIDKPGEVIPRGLPQFLSRDFTSNIQRAQSGRLQLADWVTDEKNPLTSRVIVNRVWSWLFGQGIVASTDNFGTSGTTPSNPELLDFLALEFINHGWSVKSLVREIVLSKAYQQSSDLRDDAFRADPENHWIWRANKRALDAESLRDGLLAISGRLQYERPFGSLISSSGDGTVGGPRLGGLTEDKVTQADPPVRSIYLPVPRNVLPDALQLFDFADNSAVDGARDLTIVPSQALYWMNSKSVESQCQQIAEELLADRSKEGSTAFRPFQRTGIISRQFNPSNSSTANAKMNQARIERLLDSLSTRVLSRPPLSEETQAVVAYVQERQRNGKSQTSIWTGVVRSLFASADYRFVR